MNRGGQVKAFKKVAQKVELMREVVMARACCTTIGQNLGGESKAAKLTESEAFPFGSNQTILTTLNNCHNFRFPSNSLSFFLFCSYFMLDHRAAMSASRISPLWLLTLFTVLAVLSAQARALHVYMDGQQRKCFFEELPKDTLVVGTRDQFFSSVRK